MRTNIARRIKAKAQREISKLANNLIGPIDALAYGSFYNFPFGDQPTASSSQYLEIWTKEKEKRYSVSDEYERKCGHSIDRNWLNNLALRTQVVIKDDDICYQHGRILYSTLSAYIERNSLRSINIFETGTARGFSALCMAKAMQDSDQQGKIVTFDVLPHDLSMFWNCISDQEGPMTRSEMLRDYGSLMEDYIIFIQGDSKHQCRKVSIPRVNFAFLDGEHTKEYVCNEFKYIKNRQAKGDMVCFDDYTPNLFPGVVEAVDEICERYNYSKEILTVSAQRGYAIAQKK